MEGALKLSGKKDICDNCMANLESKMNNEQMNIVIVGHVDHGKSTVIGRLLSDTGSLPLGKLEQIREKCRRESREFEFAFLLDALRDEQQQGITIDSARVFFKTKKRRYIIIDAPGHIEFLKNMISGAARAEAAMLVIDAHEGIQENSKRHAYMLSMLGIKSIMVIVNKMDMVDWSKERFFFLIKEFKKYLDTINVSPTEFIPVSARHGDNIAHKGERLDWYSGPTVLDALDFFKKESLPKDKPARMPLQGIYKFTAQGDSKRLFAGRVESGTFRVGDKIVFLPSNKVSVIDSIEEFNVPGREVVSAGKSISFTIKEQIYVNRGDIMSKVDEALPKVGRRFEANIFWMGKKPLEINKKYVLKIGTEKVECTILKIHDVMDASSLKKKKTDLIERHEVAFCLIETKKPIAFDINTSIHATSRFVLVDEYNIAGGGIITSKIREPLDVIRKKVFARDEKWVTGDVKLHERKERFAQDPRMILITGKSGLDKISIAKSLERELFRAGRNVYFLCIGNLLRGIDSDISKIERDEHLRRLGEVGYILINAGQIVIATASDIGNDDIDILKTIIGENNLISVGLKQKLDIFLQEEDIENSVNRIIGYLKEKQVIFVP